MQGVKTALIQDMQFVSRHQIRSSVQSADCYICGKGLEEGHSITAKSLPNGIVMFCDVHYSLQ